MNGIAEPVTIKQKFTLPTNIYYTNYGNYTNWFELKGYPIEDDDCCAKSFEADDTDVYVSLEVSANNDETGFNIRISNVDFGALKLRDDDGVLITEQVNLSQFKLKCESNILERDGLNWELPIKSLEVNLLTEIVEIYGEE